MALFTELWQWFCTHINSFVQLYIWGYFGYFVVSGVTGFFFPQRLNDDLIGFTMGKGVTSQSEFFAVYGGVQWAYAAALMASIVTGKGQLYAVAMVGIFSAGYSFGRIVSLVVHGRPDNKALLFLGLELFTCIAALIILLAV